MNILLIFFALPVATIILAIVLQKILQCPILVAATFFAIYLVVTFAVFDASFLVFTIAYTILAFITASIVRFICNCTRNNNNNCNCLCNQTANTNSCIIANNDTNAVSDNSMTACIRIRERPIQQNCPYTLNVTATPEEMERMRRTMANSINNTTNNNSCGCGCGRR